MCWVGLLFLAAALTRNVEGYLSALAGALSLLVIRWEWSSWQRASWGLDWGDGWEAGLMCGFLLALTLGCLVRVMSGAQGGLAGRLGSLLVYSGMEVRKQLAIGVTLLVALPIVSFNPRQRTLLGIELAARRENWSRVEKLAGGISLLPPEARIQLFRALYHRDLLLKDLFQYSLGVDSDLLPSLYSAGTAVCLPLSDLLLELGHQNLSLRYAHEAMEVMGERPAILERIAGLNLLQGRSHAARIYLNRMSQIPFQAGTAALLLDAVDKARGAFGGIDLDAARELAVDVPQAEMRFGGELLARLAWDSNLSNRMAFELLTAERLWRGDSRSVLHDLGGFQQLGYRQLPRLVQESIAGSVPMADRGSPIVEGWTIDREVMEARAQYGKLRQRSNVSPDVRVLREAFGGTYFFHLDWIQAHGQTQQ
jgi:hypothetical protein